MGTVSLDEAKTLPDGFHFLPAYLSALSQVATLDDVKGILEEAPLFVQRMPKSGAALSVRMSNAGDFGWVTDKEHGYRYQNTHPITGRHWPPIPERLRTLWTKVTGEASQANLCLINYYDAEARLGLHQDKGEFSTQAPVVSISLGDEAEFVVGGMTRKTPTQSFRLRSGDIVWFGGPGRMVYHGVARTFPGTSSLLREHGFDGGRINVTLRRIDEGDGISK